MNAIEQRVRSTLGKPWNLSIDSPIGIKKSVLRFSCDEAGRLAGDMTDLFGKLLPLQDLSMSEDSLSWQLLVTRPIKLNMTFHARLDGGAIKGKICSKYPDINFEGTVPLA